VDRDEPIAETLLLAIGRLCWGFRLELAVIAGLWIGWDELVSALGGAPAAVIFVTVGFVVLVVPGLRRLVARSFHRTAVRRSWARAVRAARITPLGDRVPRVLAVHEVPAGHRLVVQTPMGSCVAHLEAASEVMAAALGLSEVRVRRERANASRASVTLVRRDPLGGEPLAWPAIASESVSLWDPIPVGLDEDGQVVAISLPEHNLLLGGEPGAGKSVALALLVASAALDPKVKLWLLDGKLVELAPWAACAAHSVGPDVAQATEVLRALRAEMDLRYVQLLSTRRRKVAAGDGLVLHVVVCDELALYLAGPDRKRSAEFAEVLRDLVARGRAAGVIVLAATQKPSSDVVPTSLRDLFGFRWAMRCATREASDTILGGGWATQGFSAGALDPGQRGVGYLLHEGGLPARLRAFYLDDDSMAVLAARAELLRRQALAKGDL
jgi:hypothetical protein